MNDSHAPGTGFTARLSDWIAGTPRTWPRAAVDGAERSVVDTVGCLIGGAGDESVRRVGEGLGRWGSNGTTSRVGMPEGIDAPWAALINGTAAHALDYDDVLEPAATHPSAVLVPSLLALAEEIDASGADLVDAYIVGIEVQECLGEAVNMAHYARGWHTTLTLGAPSAAAAGARLLRLGAVQTRHALGLATSLAAGFKRQFGTNAKPFHAGLAAKNGILAARMAEAGLTADAEAFEGERGFLDLMAGRGAAGFGAALRRLAGPVAVVAPGLWLKRYPCCASTHRAIDAVIAMCREERLAAADIVRVDTLVSEWAMRNLMYDRPNDEMQARFSMPYCLAAACLDGDLRLGTFRRSSVARVDIARFLPCVTMTPDPQQPAEMPSTVRSWATTTITTTDGRHLTRKVIDPKGCPGNPLAEGELAEKFRDCACGQPEALRSSYAQWRGVAAHPSVRTLCTLLREARSTPAAGGTA